MIVGIADEQRQQKKDANKKRGSVDNAGRLKKLLAGSGQQTGKADWSAADPRWIAGVVHAVTRLGGAVSFGYSRDMGAYSVSIMLDGERETLWFNGGSDIDAELEGVYATFDTGQA
jgi:hypothetical protein